MREGQAGEANPTDKLRTWCSAEVRVRRPAREEEESGM